MAGLDGLLVSWMAWLLSCWLVGLTGISGWLCFLAGYISGSLPVWVAVCPAGLLTDSLADSLRGYISVWLVGWLVPWLPTCSFEPAVFPAVTDRRPARPVCWPVGSAGWPGDRLARPDRWLALCAS
jgi:hypothetical protein